MNLNDPISAYCERTGPGLLAEPLNAASNLAFFYAALRLWSAASAQAPHVGLRLRVLAVLLALVGAGSLSFHTVATGWASILDVLFIGVFNVVFLVDFLEVLARWRRASAWTAGAAFVAFDRTCGWLLPAQALNGSVLYLPATIVLVLLTASAWRVSPPAGPLMLRACALFAVSLLARSVDRALCPAWAWGTHWIWHCLNAWVLFTLAMALTRAQVRSTPQDLSPAPPRGAGRA
jgi:hypothetical protein